MNAERLKKLEAEVSMIEEEIGRIKAAKKNAEDRLEEKLLELRAEIKRDDSQEEMEFAEPGGPVDAEYTVESDRKSLPAHGPLSLPENAGEVTTS